MAQFFTLLTEIGQAKLANAIALGQTIEITQLAVGDGGGSLPEPQGDETQLVNEVRRAAINTSHVDNDNPTWIVVEQVIPPDVGGWTIREVGIVDSAGDLIAYGNYPETYKPVLEEGSSRTQTVRFVLEVSDTAAVTLKVDPSVVLATREYVDDGDAAVRAATQFATYDPDRIYTTGEIVRGSDGVFYEFYDRDQTGEVQGVDPTNVTNRPHIWMEWDGVKPGVTIEWRSETLPEGYIENDGDDYSRSDYRRIFAAFGTTYGAGDGATTFGTPDDRGEFKRGLDRGRGVDSGRSLGQHQSHALQNITGGINRIFANSSGISPYGAFQGVQDGATAREGLETPRATWNITFDASRVANTAAETRSRNNAVIYLTKI